MVEYSPQILASGEKSTTTITDCAMKYSVYQVKTLVCFLLLPRIQPGSQGALLDIKLPSNLYTLPESIPRLTRMVSAVWFMSNLFNKERIVKVDVFISRRCQICATKKGNVKVDLFISIRHF